MNSNQIPQNPFKVLEDELPVEFLEEMIQLQHMEKIWFFRLGDLANNVWKWCIDNRAGYRINNSTIQPFTFEQICWYIGRKLDGKHGSASIANYARLANQIKSTKHRAQYAMLPISHLEYAASFDDKKELIKVLNLDLALTDQRGGKPPSKLNLMKAHDPERFEYESTHQEQTPEIDLGDYFPDNLEPMEKEELPVNISEVDELNAAFQALRNALATFQRRNPSLGFVANTLDAITALNQQLMQMVGEILKEKVRRE